MMILANIFTTNEIGSLNLVIFSFFIGACLAGVATVYHRRTIGALVRYLLDNNAHSPETGKTLREAEQELNIFVMLSITKNVAFRRIVSMAPLAEDGEKPSDKKSERARLADIPLYIAPEARDRADTMYSRKASEDANMWMVLLSIAVFALVAYLSTFIIPELVSMFAGMFA